MRWPRVTFERVRRFDRPTGRRLDVNMKWKAIIDEMIDTPAGGHWSELEQVPFDKQIEILDWLQATSTLPPQQGLTLQAIGHISSITAGGESERTVYDYRVLGLANCAALRYSLIACAMSARVISRGVLLMVRPPQT
jgi:hypothetical protein